MSYFLLYFIGHNYENNKDVRLSCDLVYWINTCGSPFYKEITIFNYENWSKPFSIINHTFFYQLTMLFCVDSHCMIFFLLIYLAHLSWIVITVITINIRQINLYYIITYRCNSIYTKIVLLYCVITNFIWQRLCCCWIITCI